MSDHNPQDLATIAALEDEICRLRSFLRDLIATIQRGTMKLTTTVMEGHKVLTYRYRTYAGGEFKCHLLSEVGEPWQDEAEMLLHVRLGQDMKRVQVELSKPPWFVDAIVKKDLWHSTHEK